MIDLAPHLVAPKVPVDPKHNLCFASLRFLSLLNPTSPVGAVLEVFFRFHIGLPLTRQPDNTHGIYHYPSSLLGIPTATLFLLVPS
jgi:hypothetical protein